MKRNTIYSIVIALGFLQTLGYLVGSKELRGLGAATASSPLPLVFTEVKGVETFSSRFFLTYQTDRKKTIEITPEIYSSLQGPYNRRNVLGAAFAYAPLLPDSIRSQILTFALCKANILQEMEVEKENVQELRLDIWTKTRNRKDHWSYAIHCK